MYQMYGIAPPVQNVGQSVNQIETTVPNSNLIDSSTNQSPNEENNIVQ